MDNRTDTTEDQQATPEHPQVKPHLADGPGMTAGPHNDPPKGPGVEDTYRPPSDSGSQSASAWKSLQQTAARYPWQLVLSAAGLGLAVALLSRRRGRAR